MNDQPRPARMTESRAHRAQHEHTVQADTFELNRLAANLWAAERTPTAIANGYQWGDVAPATRQAYLARARAGERA